MPVEIGPISVIEDQPAASGGSAFGFLGSVAKDTLNTFADRYANNLANKLSGVNPAPASKPGDNAPATAAKSETGFSWTSPYVLAAGAAVALLAVALLVRNRS